MKLTYDFMLEHLVEIREMFEERLMVEACEDECRLWTGHVARNGYGVLKFAGRRIYAHRLAWFLERGSLPDKICVLHGCDTPLCTRVGGRHLFSGTKTLNNLDRHLKGRTAVGEATGHAKLSPDDVRLIRELYKPGRTEFNTVALAHRFGISDVAVGKILRGKTWNSA